MCSLKRTISCIILCALIVSLCVCGNENKSEDNAAIYGETIGRLEDNELFAIIEINASHPVLLVTSQVYDDGMGNQAAITCDVILLGGWENQKYRTD